jgi:putative transposase
MSNHNHLNHSTLECKYHIVFTPKYWRKTLYGQLRKYLKDTFHRLALQKEFKIQGGFLMPDHVHMMVSIPPKHSVSNIFGFLKGKRSIWFAQNIAGKHKNFSGHKFLARGYFVSTVGVND